MANSKGRHRNRTEPANTKEQAGMGKIVVRAYVSKESDARLERIAERENRTKQAQYGFWFDQLASLADDDGKREQLRELGLLSRPATA